MKFDAKARKMSVTGEILKAGMKIQPPNLSVTGPKISFGVPKDTSTYHQKEHAKMKDFISLISKSRFMM